MAIHFLPSVQKIAQSRPTTSYRKYLQEIGSSLGVIAIVIGASIYTYLTHIITPTQLVSAAHNPQVLGEQLEPRIYITDANDGFSSRLINWTTTDAPILTVRTNDFNQTTVLEATLYESNKEVLLKSLIHDQDGALTQKVDTAGLRSIYTQKIPIEPKDKYNYTTDSLALPINGSGLWLLEVKGPVQTRYANLVRSQVGVMTRKSEQELVFWAQNYESLKREPGGTLTTYSLLNEISTQISTDFNGDGIASTSIRPGTDIAIRENSGQFTLIPINLQYLEYEAYDGAGPSAITNRYFLFTDRPIYQPGDVINYKGIIRRDNDNSFSIPVGQQAKIEISQGWGDDPIFTSTHTISSYGAIDGKYQIPEDLKTGTYSVKLSIPGANASQDNDWGWYGSEYTSAIVEIEHFRKPEYTISANAENEVIAGHPLEFTIQGNYFSGQPLSNQPVEYVLNQGQDLNYWTLQDASQVQDYYRYGYWSESQFKSATTTLDNNGRATITIPAEEVVLQGNDRIMSLEVSYTDASGNPTYDRRNILVRAGEFGIYTDTGRYYSYVQGDTTQIGIELFPYTQTSIANVDITVAPSLHTWTPQYDTNNVITNYESKETVLPNTIITTDSQGKATLKYKLDTHGSYTFTLSSIDDKKNFIKTTLNIYAYDTRYPYFSQEQAFTLTTDKQTYLPQDRGTLSLNALTPGQDMFLSFDRRYMHRYQIVNLPQKTNTVNFAIEGTDMPNIFANVSSFSSQKFVSQQLNIPVSTESKKIITTITSDKTTYGPADTVTLDISTKNTQGEPVSAQTTVWAIDKALLELSESKLPDIFNRFWSHRYYGTWTSHSLNDISSYSGAEKGGCFLPDTQITMSDGSHKPIQDIQISDVVKSYDIESNTYINNKVTDTYIHEVPGYLNINNLLEVTPEHLLMVNGTWKTAGEIQHGDVLNMSGSSTTVTSIEWLHIPAKVYNFTVENTHTYIANGIVVHNDKGSSPRQIFKDAAYWNPSVITGSDGKSQLRFKLPDNLTTWVIAGVSANESTQVGQTSTEIVTTKDLVIRPVLPNLLRVGDKPYLSAMIHNFSKTDYQLTPKLTSTHIMHSGELPQASFVSAGNFLPITWPVEVTTASKQAKFTYQVTTDNTKENDTVIHTLPVIHNGYWDESAQVSNTPTSFKFEFAPDALVDESKINLYLSSSLLGTVLPSMEYLINYPYGCVEQTVSRLIPIIIAKQNPQIFSDVIKDKNIDDMLEKGISRLSQLQQSNGAWSWWYNNQQGDPFITSYVLEYLLQARPLLDDPQIADLIIDRSRRYVDSQLQQSSPDNLIPASFAFEALEPKYNQTITSLNGLPSDLLALAIMLNSKNGLTDPEKNGVQILLSRAKSSDKYIYWEDQLNTPRFSSSQSLTGLAIRALTLANADPQIISKAVRYEIDTRTRGYWYNTFATAQLLQGIVDYTRRYEQTTATDYTITLDDKRITSGTLPSKKQIPTIVIPTQELNGSSHILAIKTSSQAPLYSTLQFNQWRTNTKDAAKNSGLHLTKTYQSDNGTDQIAIGDEVTITLNLESDTVISYVMVEDQLPAGLVPINTQLDNENFASNTYWDWSTTKEYLPNGIHIANAYLQSGYHTFTYKARAIIAGTFETPPTFATTMYNPDVYARTNSQTVTISAYPVSRPQNSQKNETMPIPKSASLHLALIASMTAVAAIFLRLYFKRQSQK